MRLFTDLAELPAELAPSAVTVGKFDGVHGGHRAVISQLTALAHDRGLVPTVVTFDRNPLRFRDGGAVCRRVVRAASSFAVNAWLSMPGFAAAAGSDRRALVS